MRPARGPVIAAGSTGSMPATATLLATIAKLPHGALVLPGLDTELDDAAWNLIAGSDGEADAAHGHPQFAMQALLRRIGIVRDEVDALAPPAAARPRAHCVRGVAARRHDRALAASA